MHVDHKIIFQTADWTICDIYHISALLPDVMICTKYWTFKKHYKKKSVILKGVWEGLMVVVGCFRFMCPTAPASVTSLIRLATSRPAALCQPSTCLSCRTTTLYSCPSLVSKCVMCVFSVGICVCSVWTYICVLYMCVFWWVFFFFVCIYVCVCFVCVCFVCIYACVCVVCIYLCVWCMFCVL